jgi:hypothetical protein
MAKRDSVDGNHLIRRSEDLQAHSNASTNRSTAADKQKSQSPNTEQMEGGQSKECPCGLTQDKLLQAPNLSLGPGMVCTAKYADKSPRICGEPLGAHPSQPKILVQQGHETGLISFCLIYVFPYIF